MKNLKRISGSLLIVGMMIGSFMMGNTPQSVNDSLTLQNLKALQASAGELSCNQTNEKLCVIQVYPPGGGPSYQAISTGVLTYND